MAISTVTIYRCTEHQPSNGIHKIGSWSSYALETVANVKNTGDINQNLILPYSANILTANAVGFDSKIYDIISIRRSTLANDSLELQIQYNPISSSITTSSTMAGYWERTPSIQNYGATFDIGDDTYKYSRKEAFATLATISGIAGQPYYYQIVSTWDIYANATSKDVVIYGGYAPYLTSILRSGNLSTISYLTSTDSRYFPSLPQVISELDNLIGMPGTSVLSISLSPRSPFRTSAITNGISVLTGAGSTVTPLNSGKTATCALIDVTNSEAGANTANGTGVTITLSEFEHMCGRLFVVDDKGNEIAMIPNQWINSSHQLTYTPYTYSDLNGIYTYIVINGNVITIPEAQIPWIGDSWAEYKAYSLQYDREAMVRARENVDKQFLADASTSVGNTALNMVYAGGMAKMASSPERKNSSLMGAGAAGGAGVLDLVSKKAAGDIEKYNLKRNQIEKENMMKRGPSTAVNTQYGLDACFLPATMSSGYAGIKIEIPNNLTSTDYTNYVAYRGYPCNLYKSFTATTGYYKGVLYTVPSGMNGPQLDLLREMFNGGVKLC